MNSIHVHMLPDSIDGFELSRSVVVVIDVLRASSTIIHALGNGARCILPCSTVEAARDLASQAEDSRDILLGGERQGRLIEGFDLDNSPLKYSRSVVSGKKVIFTTTNGTLALARCESSGVVLIGAFVNQSAVVQKLIQLNQDVHLLCAGTDGQLTAEDILCAGAMAADLSDQAPDAFRIDDVQAQMAIDFYQARSRSEALFRQTMFDSLGGRNLLTLGLKADVERCMQRDLFNLVPVWDPATKIITVESASDS